VRADALDFSFAFRCSTEFREIGIFNDFEFVRLRNAEEAVEGVGRESNSFSDKTHEEHGNVAHLSHVFFIDRPEMGEETEDAY